MKPVILLLGRRGSGKSTVAAAYEKHAGSRLPVIQLGNVARAYILAGDVDTTELYETYRRTGEYETAGVLKLLGKHLAAHPACANGFILDGFPRQAKDIALFDAFLQDNGFRVTRAIVFHITKSTSRSRQLKRKRDPTEFIDLAEKRFSEEEAKVIDHYREKRLLRIIRAGNFKRQSKPAHFVPVQARNLARIIRAARQRKRSGR